MFFYFSFSVLSHSFFSVFFAGNVGVAGRVSRINSGGGRGTLGGVHADVASGGRRVLGFCLVV